MQNDPPSADAPPPEAAEDDPSSEPLFFVRLDREWAHIDDVCDFVTRVAAKPLNQVEVQRLHTVLHELLSNAFNFGLLATPVELEVSTKRGRFEVKVSNATVAARRDLLDRTIRRLEQSEAHAGYLDAMARQQTGKGKTQLREGIGLSRLRAEAKVELALRQPRPGWVTVVARRT